MVAERKLKDINLLYICEGKNILEESVLSVRDKVKLFVVGKCLKDLPSVLEHVSIDVVLLAIEPSVIEADALNSFLVNMKIKTKNISVIVITTAGDFADNLTEADFVVSKWISSEELERLIKIC